MKGRRRREKKREGKNDRKEGEMKDVDGGDER